MIIVHPANRSKITQPPRIPGIECIHSVNLLGVHFSEKMLFAEHISHVLSSVSQRFYLRKQLKIAA